MKVIQTWFQNRRSKEMREASQREGGPSLEVVKSMPTTTESTVPATVSSELIISCNDILSYAHLSGLITYLYTF